MKTQSYTATTPIGFKHEFQAENEENAAIYVSQKFVKGTIFEKDLEQVKWVSTNGFEGKLIKN